MQGGDDARPGNPNKTPKRSMFSITRARGRLRGGLYDITNTVGKGRRGTKDVEGGRRGPKVFRDVRRCLGPAKLLRSGPKICEDVRSRLARDIGS